MRLVKSLFAVGVAGGRLRSAGHGKNEGKLRFFHGVYLKHFKVIVKGNGQGNAFKFGETVKSAARLHCVAVIVRRLGRIEVESLGERAVAVVLYLIPACNRLLIENVHRHFGGIFAVFVQIGISVIINYVIIPVCGGTRSCGIDVRRGSAHVYARALALSIAFRHEARLRARACKAVRKIGRNHYSVLVVLK